MKCNYCGTEFEGKFCPNCGAPAGETTTNAEQQTNNNVNQGFTNQSAQPVYNPVPTKIKKPFYKKWWFWVIVAVVVIGVIGGSTGSHDDKKSTSSNDTSITQSVEDNNSETTNETSSETASTEKKQEETKTAETKTTTESKTETTTKASTNYETIYNEYAQKIRDAAPTSSITELAEIANEGVTKMAEYMYKAKGTDGQYATYEEWSGKLYDVYMNEAR